MEPILNMNLIIYEWQNHIFIGLLVSQYQSDLSKQKFLQILFN